jgi:glucan phosphoethanolaminetransferase (alkaline phosphatase superfamily)
MHLKSKKFLLSILAITALVCSRATFTFINDPEGPNLLIVVVLGAIIYFASLTTYLFKIAESKKPLLAFLIQIVLVASLYIYFN